MYRYAPTLLRMALGAVFVAHGAQKLFAVWGGPGLGGTASYVGSLGLSPAYPLALLLAVTEFGGGLLLILGALVRWVSLALAPNALPSREDESGSSRTASSRSSTARSVISGSFAVASCFGFAYRSMGTT